MGGCNSIDEISGRRWGNDVHYELIEMFIALQRRWIPPENISKDEYYEIKQEKDSLHPALVGFVGFCCSFGSKYFGGYASNSEGKNYCKMNRDTLLRQAPLIKNVKFTSMNYKNMKIPNGSFVYCDPPYENTTKYSKSSGFSHEEFWDWAHWLGKKGNTVFVSEYSQPKTIGFKSVFEKEIISSLSMENNQLKKERLYLFVG